MAMFKRPVAALTIDPVYLGYLFLGCSVLAEVVSYAIQLGTRYCT